MKHYTWDNKRGVIIDYLGEDVASIFTKTNKFRKLCGTLLVERLNVKARGDEAAKRSPEPPKG